MKKLCFFIIASVFTFTNANAVTINVDVNANNTFTPANFAAVVGDVVVWTLKGGSHTVNSISTPVSSIPAGAAPLNSGALNTIGQTYTYNILVAGTYGYQCNFHGNLAAFTGMIGGFNVTATSITEPVVNLITIAYPNPFNDKITIKYNGIETIEVFNVIGDKLKAMELSAVHNKAEIDLSNFPAGIYFYRTYKEGTIVETRKIVKAN